MRLSLKICLPMAAVVGVLGVGSFLLVSSQLREVKSHTVRQLVLGKSMEMEHAIAQAGEQALAQAALYSQAPVVQQAFRLAHQGDIRAEADPHAQQARELLRAELGQSLKGFNDAMGRKFKLHFHLPNGRSLARMWRSKQAKRSGQWVDISDDISSFRQTVLDVNATGAPVSGIELGRGGFVVRGLAPVKDADGTRLGSVEVLVDFKPLLANASEGKGHSLMLFMNADKLNITTKLQDPAKFPKVGDFVLAADDTTEMGRTIPPELLAAGRDGLSLDERGDVALAAFPVRDYRKQQIGVLAYAVDTSAQAAMLGKVEWTMLGLMALVLLLPLVGITVITNRLVTHPVSGVVQKIKDIAENRADLKDRLDDSQKDEIGELALWFNKLMGRIDQIMCDQQGLVNMVNTVPDPIFAVDDDYRFIMANQATREFLGVSEEELLKRTCSELFKTDVCGTDKCPIAIAKKTQGRFTADIINIGTKENPTYIQPVGDVLKGCGGNNIGYVEVAKNVTEVVLQQREVESNLEMLTSVNMQTQEAAGGISEASGRLMQKVDEVNSGASMQRERMAETATAMEEMNATVLEVAKNADTAAQQADAAREKADLGADVVTKVVAAINLVKERATAMKTNMGALGEQAEALAEIVQLVNSTTDQVRAIATAAEQQSATSEQINRAVDEVNRIADETAGGVQESMIALNELGELADKLHNLSS